MTPAELSSEKMDWQTPGYFLDLVRAVGRIGLDPCGPATGNPTGADYKIVQIPGLGCGLRAPWYSRDLTFVNPPYGPHLSGDVDPDFKIMRRPKKVAEPVHIGTGIGWARKIIQERNTTRIALVPARPDAEWWDDMLKACDECLLWRSPTLGARIKFVNPETGKTVQGNTSPSTVFLFTPSGIDGPTATYEQDAETRRRFIGVFAPHGTLIRPIV
jgi:hypothetical protein